MKIQVLKSKLHRVKVTEANLNYEGSITIDEDLMDKVGFFPYEKVQVLNFNNGARIETYIIVGARGSNVICMNGPAARHAQVGDELIIASYGLVTPEEAKNHKPRIFIPGKSEA